MPDDLKRRILGRRAAFLAAAIAASTCGGKTTGDDAGADTSIPVPCLGPPAPTDASPQPCLEPLPQDAGPQPCLDVAPDASND